MFIHILWYNVELEVYSIMFYAKGAISLYLYLKDNFLIWLELYNRNPNL